MQWQYYRARIRILKSGRSRRLSREKTLYSFINRVN